MAGLDPSILAALKDSSAEDRARRAAKRNESKADDDYLLDPTKENEQKILKLSSQA